jgi:hypothetical protein
MENVATYSEARSEYTKQLATFVVPTVVGWFQTLWSRNSADRQRCLTLFQSECEEIPRWNQDRIHDEVRVLLEKSGCDYMEELMTAVFIAHTKVLTAVRLSTKQKKLSITVPKLDHFIHRIFRESARSFWKTPFLFMTDGGVVDRQKNLLQIEGLAVEAITTAVRSLLPVKQILHDYLGEDEEEIEEAAVTQKEVEEVKEAAEAAEVEEVKEAVEEKAVEKVKEVKEEVKEEAKPATAPAIVNIDTEPSVTFSDYDDVIGKEPEIIYNPKDDDDDKDDALTVDESTTTSIDDDDVEDLEAPPPKLVRKEEVMDDSVEILE